MGPRMKRWTVLVLLLVATWGYYLVHTGVARDVERHVKRRLIPRLLRKAKHLSTCVPRTESDGTRRPGKVVFWTPLFDQSHDTALRVFAAHGGGPLDPYDAANLPAGCSLFATDENGVEWEDATVVVFHAFSIDSWNLPPHRFCDQAWLLWNAEPPYKYVHRPSVEVDLTQEEDAALFQLHASYLLDADVVTAYITEGSILSQIRTALAEGEVDMGVVAEKLRWAREDEKGAAAFFLARNCDAVSGRNAVLRELGKHIRIHSWGKCMPSHPDHLPEDLLALDRSTPEFKWALFHKYPFYLAFENSRSPAYVTEKVLEGLLAPTSIPVVLGAPDKDAFFPSPDVYIDVDAYAGRMDDLAREMLALLDDEDAFARKLLRKGGACGGTFDHLWGCTQGGGGGSKAVLPAVDQLCGLLAGMENEDDWVEFLKTRVDSPVVIPVDV